MVAALALYAEMDESIPWGSVGRRDKKTSCHYRVEDLNLEGPVGG